MNSKDFALSVRLSRRSFLSGLSVVATSSLAACTQTPKNVFVSPVGSAQAGNPPVSEPIVQQNPGPGYDYEAIYASMEDGGYHLPAIPYRSVKPRFLRCLVDDPTGEPAGTLVVNTNERLLFLVLKNGKALQYGVGLGRSGFSWKGRAVVQWKRKWPTWTPPRSMINRNPELEKWAKGMPPGLHNPMGSRALYIFEKGEDTLYRIHGSPDWQSIGKAASSGCVRMFNQDVIDLYEHVPSKTPLLVI
jgi:lipoprotein-anchoring transpeptidase ErfK/SrfK